MRSLLLLFLHGNKLRARNPSVRLSRGEYFPSDSTRTAPQKFDADGWHAAWQAVTTRSPWPRHQRFVLSKNAQNVERGNERRARRAKRHCVADQLDSSSIIHSQRRVPEFREGEPHLTASSFSSRLSISLRRELFSLSNRPRTNLCALCDSQENGARQLSLGLHFLQPSSSHRITFTRRATLARERKIG